MSQTIAQRESLGSPRTTSQQTAKAYGLSQQTETWSERAIKRLIEVAALPNTTASRIACDLKNKFEECESITRSAVLGKLFRLKIALPNSRSDHPGRSRAPYQRRQGSSLEKPRESAAPSAGQAASPTINRRRPPQDSPRMTMLVHPGLSNSRKGPRHTSPATHHLSARSAPQRPPTAKSTQAQGLDPASIEPNTLPARKLAYAATELLISFHTKWLDALQKGTELPSQEPIATYWRCPEPRYNGDEDRRTCTYPTIYDQMKRRHLFCSEPRFNENRYCAHHHSIVRA